VIGNEGRKFKMGKKLDDVIKLKNDRLLPGPGQYS
jgi:hypothetical protein